MISVDKYADREYAKCYGLTLQRIWSIKGWKISLKIDFGSTTWIVRFK